MDCSGPVIPGGCLGPSHAESDTSGVVSGPAGPWGAKTLDRSPHMSSHGFHIVRVNGVNSMVGPRGPPPPGVRCISCYVLANGKGIVNQRAGPRRRGQDMKRSCLPCTQFIEHSPSSLESLHFLPLAYFHRPNGEEALLVC